MTLLKQLNMLESAGLVSIAQLEPDLEYRSTPGHSL